MNGAHFTNKTIVIAGPDVAFGTKQSHSYNGFGKPDWFARPCGTSLAMTVSVFSRMSWRCICQALTIVVLSISFAGIVHAQDAGDPLTIQGLDQFVNPDIRSRAMGGTAIASANSASAIFSNPAGLARVNQPEVRVSGLQSFSTQTQSQDWVPNRFYSGLSLMLENDWGNIKEPDLTGLSADAAQWEKLQKAYDLILPDWSRKHSDALPMSLSAAAPIELGEFSAVVALGVSHAIQLDHYFQDNNVLDPDIGLYRPQPTPIVQSGDTAQVRWYQTMRQRKGTIYGITPGFSLTVYDWLNVGASATYYTGKSDDMQARVDRGLLTFIYNRFKVDPSYYSESWTGTSTYTGLKGSFGLLLRQERFSIGFTMNLPMTLKRSFDGTFETDTVDLSTQIKQGGNEKINFPLSYSLGILVTPTAKWSLAFDYDVSHYGSIEYLNDSGLTSKPWVDGHTFGIGGEYTASDWLRIRGGYREQMQSFAPAGSPIIGEPARAYVYSAGVGLDFEDIQVNAAYEYSNLKYQDLWQSNINFNSVQQQSVLLELGYKL